MASLLRSLLPARQPARGITTTDDYLAALNGLGYYGGIDYAPGLTGTWGHQAAERIPNDFEGYARNAYGENGIIFGLMGLRMSVFSAIRFSWQRIDATRPSELFGSRTLQLLETPWPGGTTQDLLARTIQDADLAGNAYWTVQGGQMVRLRPDWVQIAMAPRMVRGAQVGWELIGYAYWEGGIGASDPVAFTTDEVAHFAPSPDPQATYRGMSWLTPVLREISNDKAMVLHQQKYFENAAVPSLSVSLDKDIRHEAFLKFKDAMDANHRGIHNAYRTLFLGGGADVKVIGSDLQQLDFKRVQGAGESRLAAAAGVPPMLAGLAEGMRNTNFAMYAAARRRFADGTMHPLWENVAGTFAQLIPGPPPGAPARLWFDPRQVPFLREDRKDAAEIQRTQAAVIRSLIEAGYDPDSVVRAVNAENMALLIGKHSGLTSVQLQPPVSADGAPRPTTPDPESEPLPPDSPDPAGPGGEDDLPWWEQQ